MKKIYSIPFGCDFIDVLKDFILGRSKDISNVAVVFPGKRPSLYLKRRLAEHFQKPFYGPTFFSIEEFIDYIVKHRYDDFSDIEYSDAIWLLYQSVRSLKAFNNHALKNKGFGEFFSWGRYMLDFINQLDMENIPNTKLLSLENNAKIGYDIPESINKLLMNISILREEFHASLKEQKCFTTGLKHQCSLEIIEEIDFSEFEMICFAGLFAAGEVEKKLIKTICEKGKGEIIIEGVPEEWPVLKQFVSYLGADIEQIECQAAEPSQIAVYAGFDTHSEIMKAHEILKTVNSKKTALVLPLSESLFPLLTFAIDRIDTKYNISLGYPFSRTSVFDLISNMLNAQLTKRKGGLYSTGSYLQLILHPFIKNLESLENVRSLIYYIEKSLTGDIRSIVSGKPFIRLEEVDSMLQGKESVTGNEHKILKELHEMFFQNIEKADNLFEMSEALEKSLQFILAYTPLRSYVLSGEIFKLLYESLEHLKHARFCKETLHPDQEENKRILCDFILHHLKTINLPFETKPIEDLEIIGVLESRNIAFDTVIMLDVNEGIMPQPKKIDPLIPLGIYEKLGIPSPEFNEEIYRYYFYRLIKSAKDVHILYIDAEDKQRSRYIEQIIWEHEKLKRQLNVIPIEQAVNKVNLRPGTSLPEIKKTDIVMQKLKNMVCSPSAIDNYLKCPTLFYYNNILNFEEKRVVTEDIDVMDRGNLIHRILFDTFKVFMNREINPLNYDDILTEMQEEIENSFKDKVVTGDYYLFKTLAGYKLEGFLRKNIRNASGPFIIRYLEETVRGDLSTGDVPVRFKGRIDRVDLSPYNREYTIIDYKTGNTKQYSQNILKKTDFSSIEDIHENVASFQLPLYVYLFQKMFSVPIENINAKLILLKNNEENLLFEDNRDVDRESVLDMYIHGVKTVLTDLLDSSKPFKPFDDDLCGTCPFNGLCRQ
ncbi:MAG: PD-(D/E)XK nuclease family protein [Proteobacteria bacterium]|nr:PD-(D/E)XK nuclease family protein [Pseudomonadota bacterium]